MKELVLMKRQLSAVTEKKIDSSLIVLPARQQLAFKTAVMAAKVKSRNGQRYDAKWLMTFLLLHISSPKAYSDCRHAAATAAVEGSTSPNKGHSMQIWF